MFATLHRPRALISTKSFIFSPLSDALIGGKPNAFRRVFATFDSSLAHCDIEPKARTADHCDIKPKATIHHTDLHREDFIALLKALSKDEATLGWTVNKLGSGTKRRLLGALLLDKHPVEDEHFQADQVFMILDANRDGMVSRREFRTWFNQYYFPGLLTNFNGSLEAQTKGQTTTVPNSEGDAVSVVASDEEDDDVIEAKRSEIPEIPRRTKILVLMRSSIPYIVFGIMDNSLMLVFGEYIDQTIGVTLCLSTMTAAGLGNTMSCATGVISGGFIERLTYNVGAPKLTREQAESSEIKNIHFAGSVFGIIIGCSIGMFPLLLMNQLTSDRSAERSIE